jgi:YaiO family outer membrane protein
MVSRIVLLILSIVFIFSLSEAQVADTLKNTISVNYSYHHFDRQFKDQWQLGSIEYKRTTFLGAVLARINYADRLGREGLQYEVDVYPKLSEKVYLYANIGYSNKMPVFPKWRSGLSIFLSLPKGWEAEGGVRQLRFTENIWIGTAGLSKYAGTWLLNVRSFFGPDKESSQSYFFNARKYLKNEKDFIWFQVGRGVSPDEARNIQINTNLKLGSTKLEAGTRLFISKRNQLSLSAGWSRDEFLPEVFGNQYFGSLGINQLF